MSVNQILAIVAGLLFLIALIPKWPTYPLLAVGGLLLSVCVYLRG